MSSVGQAVGTVVGGIVGFFFGNPVLGAQIGASIGGAIDPPKGPNIKGPRLSDKSAQTASYGVTIPRIYGTLSTFGNVFWVENNEIKEVARKKNSGGKGGGGGGTVTTYEYYATFAVSLCEGEIDDTNRVWVGGQLISNQGSDDLATLLSTWGGGGYWSKMIKEAVVAASAGSSGQYKVYFGSDDQTADPRMAADIANCPAYRGLAYIVFYDWPLKEFGNSLMGAQVKAEVIQGGTPVTLTLIDTITASSSGSDKERPQCWFMNGTDAYIIEPQWAIGGATTLPATAKVKIINNESQSWYPSYSVDSDEATAAEIPAGIHYDLVPGISSSYVELINYLQTLYPYTQLDSATSFIFTGSNHYAFKTNALYNLYPYKEASQAVGYTIACITEDSDDNLCVLSGDTIYVYDDTLTLDRSFTLPINPSASRITYYEGYFYCTSFSSEKLYRFREGESAYDAYDFAKTSGADTDSTQVFIKNGGVVVRYEYVPGTNLHTLTFWRPDTTAAGLVPLSDIVQAELELSELIETADIDVTDLTDLVRGFRISEQAAIRSGLAPLSAAYPFDLIPSGYQIKAVRRGNSSVKTVEEEDLIGEVLTMRDREMDSQLPKKVIVRHLDSAREYDPNEQYSPERISSNAVNIREFDLALVLTPDEAADIAEVLEYVPWLERDTYAFKLPPTHLDLEPSDVITLNLTSGAVELRLQSIEYAVDGTLDCVGRPNDAALYAPNSVGAQGVVSDGTLSYFGSSEMILLDMPLIRVEDDYPSFGAAMSGRSSSWPSGSVYKSVDNEVTWNSVQGFAGPVVMGLCVDSLPDHDCFVTDRGNTLTVSLYSSDMTLDSITETQMMTGMNWCAYGAAGRWEIMRFAGAVLNADGSYTLDTFVRGSRGTEQYAGDHADFDFFVWLDDIDAALIGADLQFLNVPRHYRGVTSGQDIDDVTSQSFAYSGVNLKPLSPVYAKGTRSGDWTITWVKRSRYTTSYWTTGVQRPIGEDSESWSIDIINTSVSPNTVLRTLTSTTNSVTYTAAQQAADFGSPVPSTITVRIYQLSADVGRGYKLEATL